MTHYLLTAMSAFFILLLQAGCNYHGCCSSCANGEETEKGFEVLFDGTSTDAFRGWKLDGFPEKGWVIEEGALRKVAQAGGGDILTKKQYDSFDLRWEWKVAEAANSGVMYHVAEANDLGATYFTGPEYQILDDSKHPDGQNPKTSSAALYGLIACNEQKKLMPVGEWNSSRLLVKGNHVEHWLNDKKVVEYELGSDELNKLIAASKFNSWKRFAKETTGHITFQDHGDDVWFRNIRIKPLSEEQAK